ncbi:MAG: hypothetical protein NVS3B1_06300 [Marmoricola sp.]
MSQPEKPPSRTPPFDFAKSVQKWSDQRLTTEIERNERDLAVYQRMHKTLMDELVRRFGPSNSAPSEMEFETNPVALRETDWTRNSPIGREPQ